MKSSGGMRRQICALAMLGTGGSALFFPAFGLGAESKNFLSYNPRLSARAVGSGALEGWGLGVDGVLGNPARLAELRRMEFSAGAGQLPRGHASFAALYALPLPETGKFGLEILSLGPSSQDPDDPFSALEQELGAAYALPFFSGVDAGVRYRALRFEDSVRSWAGQAVDAGLVFSSEPIWLGLTANNLVKPFQDLSPDFLETPRRVLIDAGVHWRGVLQACVEYGQQVEEPRRNRAALGLESDFSANWCVRAGADAHAAYAGLGARWRKWGLDYSARLGLQPQEASHWLGVNASFGAYEIGLTPSSRFLTKGGVVRSIRLSVRAPRETIFHQWSLLVSDERGKKVYEQQGRNALPSSLTWEGRSAYNQIVPDGGYVLWVEGTDREGNRMDSNRISIQVGSRQTTEFIQVK